MTTKTWRIIFAVALVIATSGMVAADQSHEGSSRGVASETDRGAADSEAYDQATMNLNQACIGYVDQSTIQKTADNCSNLGSGNKPNWRCTVDVKGMCVWNSRVPTARGVASESDRGRADSEAHGQATMNLKRSCPGTVDQSTIQKTADNCSNLGSGNKPNWRCTVDVKGMCVY